LKHQLDVDTQKSVMLPAWHSTQRNDAPSHSPTTDGGT